MRNDCPGDDCPRCDALIAERENPYPADLLTGRDADRRADREFAQRMGWGR